MNARALLFASIGLILSMMVTASWISRDMERIRTQQAAELAARCATVTNADPACTPSTQDDAAVADGQQQLVAPTEDTPSEETYRDPAAEQPNVLYDDGTYATS